MKVGDLVRQNGAMVKGLKTSQKVGVVVGFCKEPGPKNASDNIKNWMKYIGRGVIVLWSDGYIGNKPFVETALEVINESS